MKAMIFAAGLGTRLKPMTDTLPKALVPVNGKPLLEHVCMKLREEGIDDIVVNVHHFADSIEQWLAQQAWVNLGQSGSPAGQMKVRISDERTMLLETGGAVLHARKLLEGCGSFIVHNVDILSDLDIGWFASQVRPDALATLLVSDRKSLRQLLFDPETMSLVGWYNAQTGQMRSPFGDIDPSACVSKAFSGIHIMSDGVFDALDLYARSHGLYLGTDTPRFPIVDFYLWACARYNIYGVSADNLKLIDVGKLDSIALAEKLMSL